MSFITSSSFDINTVRNQPDGVAGISACKTLLNEHRPVCTYQMDLYGKALFDTQNTDIWYPIAGGGSITYATRNLTIQSTVNTECATRCIVNQTAYKMTSNFLEATTKIANPSNGTGGIRNTVFGFASAFSSIPIVERAIFYKGSDNLSYIGYRGGDVRLSTLPIGRELQAGDVLTVRLDRVEGEANINIARFYINGQKQYETLNVPQADCYCGIGVFTDSAHTTVRSVVIDYFGFKYVP